MLRQVIHDFWNSGKQPSEWDIGRLGILPKKDDLSLPGNYWGIMMLEVAQKLVSNIVHREGSSSIDLRGARPRVAVWLPTGAWDR